MRLADIRWKPWVFGCSAVLAVYFAAGFGLVPWLIKGQAPKFVQTELGRQASIGDVKFNPATLRLEARDVHLTEPDGAPILVVGNLVVEFQWRSLLRRAWSFSEIRVEAPVVSLAVAKDGRFNVAELMASFKSKPEETSAEASPVRLIIERFALEQGAVEMNDQRAGYSNNFSPINFSLSNFSTLPDQNGNYSFSAESERGGKMVWKGQASLNPLRGNGELGLENVSLPELTGYLKPYTRASVSSGTLTATLPYSFSYGDGKLEANLAGARLALHGLGLSRVGASEPFASFESLEAGGIEADLARRAVTVGEVHGNVGKLLVKRDAKGVLELATLGAPATAADAPIPTEKPPAPSSDWRLELKRVLFDQVDIKALDETVNPPLMASAGQVQLQLQLMAEQLGAEFKLTVGQAGFSLADLVLASGSQTPLRIAGAGFTGGELDLAGKRATLDRVYAQGGQLGIKLDRKGQLDVLSLLPRFSSGDSMEAKTAASTGTPWLAVAKRVELDKFGVDVDDEGTGVKLRLQEIAIKLEDASSDLSKPVKFSAELKLHEGGHLSALGQVVPASSAVQSDLRAKQLSLAPLQPLVGKYVKLKLVGGAVSAQGRLTTGSGKPKNPTLQYLGSIDVTGLALNEDSGAPFAQWKNVGADKLTFSMSPNLLEIPELRVLGLNTTLIIEDDRSLNAARLLVPPPVGNAVAETSPKSNQQAAQDVFPVRLGRVRVKDARLDFTDLSLRPQFGAKIYELQGVVNGLSSSRNSRSQLELDGRVDQYGMARIRGEFNPFAPRDNTDINVVFKNVDMVSASPYAMKFAGYRIAEGKISLDLQYKVRNSQLEGANQIVIDKLTLGERVDSPDALKLPLELALAILKDNDGRIDLGLPISGNMDDPQFSYGAIVWKAIGNVLTKIVTAPFRALGSLFGVSGDELESVGFDAGSSKLDPPEREKLKKVAQVLSKRAQLKLAVPGQYSESADGAALKKLALRRAVLARSGVSVDAQSDPGPLDLGSQVVRTALGGLFVERFGAEKLAEVKKALEPVAVSPAQPEQTDRASAGAAGKPSAVPEGTTKSNDGEAKAMDATVLYRSLQERLEQSQPLAADSLSSLGAQRASAIVAALKEFNIEAPRVATSEPEAVTGDVDKTVALKLVLSAK